MRLNKINPINLSKEDKDLIFNENTYNYQNIYTIEEYKNAFITRSGIGMKRFNMLTDSIPHYKGKSDHFRKYLILQFLLRPKIKVWGDFLLIHNHWCPGYYHWITEALPRVIRASAHLNSHILLLPKNFPQYTFDSLKPFNVNFFLIPQKKNIIAEKVLIPENTRYTARYDRNSLSKLRGMFHDYLKQNSLDDLNLGKKIYVTRAGANNRKVFNEHLIESSLNNQGYKIIKFEDYSFWEQVSIMYHAEVLISIHGAGLTNQAFMTSGSFVMELQKTPNRDGHYSDIYLKLANILNNNYLYQFCDPITATSDIYSADLVIDLDLFNRNLEIIDKMIKDL